jgi:branched-chain amino acid transport system substrate-binding protein
VRISDWIAPDWGVLRPIIEASANKYAAEHNITPRDCVKETVASN